GRQTGSLGGLRSGAWVYTLGRRAPRYRSSSGCTHLYGVISRASVSLIMRAEGACRPLLQDRHFSDASNFQIGVSRVLRIASSGRLARVLHRAHSISSEPKPPLRHWPIVGDGCAGPP